MAIALVTGQKAQTQTATGATSFPVALPAGATAGNIVVLAVVYFGGTRAATFVTDNAGNTWAQAGVWKTSGGGDLVGLFYAANVAAGTKTITVHYSAAMTRVTLCAAEFSGVDTTTALDNTNSGTGSSRSPNSGTITPATANELFLFAVTPDASTTIATVTGWTNLGKEQSTSTFGEMGFDFLVNSGSTALGVNQTNLLGSSTTWACIIAAFKVAGGTDGSVTLTGTASTSSASAGTESGSATHAITGATITSNAGNVTAGVSGSVALSGASAASGHGTTAESGTAKATPSGAASASTAGAVTARTSAIVAITSASASLSAANLAGETGGASTTLTGTASTSSAGATTESGASSVSPSGASGTGNAGTVTATGVSSGSVTIIGTSVTSAAGTVAHAGGGKATLAGVVSISSAGTVIASSAGGDANVNIVGASTGGSGATSFVIAA